VAAVLLLDEESKGEPSRMSCDIIVAERGVSRSRRVNASESFDEGLGVFM
jgi:hypothetical protein